MVFLCGLCLHLSFLKTLLSCFIFKCLEKPYGFAFVCTFLQYIMLFLLWSQKSEALFSKPTLCVHTEAQTLPTHTQTHCSDLFMGAGCQFFWLNTPLGPFCLFLPYFTTFHVLSSFLSLVSSVCLFIYFSGCLFSLFNGENCLCHAPPSISNITCTGATSNSSPNATFEKHFLFNTQLSFCSGMFVCVTLKEKMFRPWGLVTVEFMDVT